MGRDIARKLLAYGLRGMGVSVLNRSETVAYLRPHTLVADKGAVVTLPTIRDFAEPVKQLFGQWEPRSEDRYVWQYEVRHRPVRVLPQGGVLLGNTLPQTDFGNLHLLRDLLRPDKRNAVTADTVLAPLSHCFDGVNYTGYYDYMFLVAAKLCRMKAALPPDVFAEAAVSYPLTGTSYERDVLSQLGIRPDRIFDSRQTNVQFRQCLLANKESWFYPNRHDVADLQTYLGPAPGTIDSPGKRLYVSRIGRRRVLNEDELVRMLLRYDFQFIDDRPRSLSEQVALYRNASLIMGPHGASFTNILWCCPGAQLIELFNPHYVTEPYLYLATLTKVRYAAYCNGPRQPTSVNAVGENLTVSVADIERGLVQWLQNEAKVSRRTA